MLLRNTNEIKLCLVTLIDIAAVVYTIYICRHKWEFKFKKLQIEILSKTNSFCD